MNRTGRLLLVVTLLLSPSGTSPEAQVDAPVEAIAERANAAFAASDWPMAYALYTQLASVQPEDATVWFRLGLATLNAGESAADAVIAYEKAIELGYPSGPARYGMARAHALRGDRAGVLGMLATIAEAGPSLGISLRIESEPAFDALRPDPEFAAAVQRLTPCASEEYRQFDFWLGTWDVVSPQGQPLGTNTISEALDGCMILEQWESLSGSKGFSINYYDRESGTWTQTYRDNAGNVSGWPDLVGGLRDGSMVLESLSDPQNMSRWTWTPLGDDRVRQMSEVSNDGGETWQVSWDSIYERAPGGS